MKNITVKQESLSNWREEFDIDEAKVEAGRSDYGKASVRNKRKFGKEGEPAVFDASGERGKMIDQRRAEHKAKRGVKEGKGYQPEIEHSKLGDAKKKKDKERESKLPPHLQGDAIGKMKKAFASEDKAFNFVLDKIRKEVGKDGYVSKDNPRKPQTDAEKAKVRAHQAKVDKENAAERAKDPSQGRYPKG